MMKEGEEYLFALHHFEAENDDEVSFMAGERIIVREKDDAYNDGWYQVSHKRSKLDRVGALPSLSHPHASLTISSHPSSPSTLLGNERTR